MGNKTVNIDADKVIESLRNRLNSVMYDLTLTEARMFQLEEELNSIKEKNKENNDKAKE